MLRDGPALAISMKGVVKLSTVSSLLAEDRRTATANPQEWATLIVCLVSEDAR